MADFGNWKVREGDSKSGYTFVYSDNKNDSMALSDVEVKHYGGFLVAESIKDGEVANLIAHAPAMRDLLIDLIDIEGPQPGHVYWYRKVKAVLESIEVMK